jgi:hypothetical protein
MSIQPQALLAAPAILLLEVMDKEPRLANRALLYGVLSVVGYSPHDSSPKTTILDPNCCKIAITLTTPEQAAPGGSPGSSWCKRGYASHPRFGRLMFYGTRRMCWRFWRDTTTRQQFRQDSPSPAPFGSPSFFCFSNCPNQQHHPRHNRRPIRLPLWETFSIFFREMEICTLDN